MKKIFLFCSVVVLALFVVSCVPQSGSEEEGAMAGQAVRGGAVPAPDLRKGDVFILPFTQNQNLRSSVGEILEYKSADNIRKQNPTIKFKIWSSGDTHELAIDQNGQASLALGGKRFAIQLTNPNIDHSPIRVDFTGDGAVDIDHQGAKLHFKEGWTYVNGRGLWCEDVIELLVGETREIFFDDLDRNVTLSLIGREAGETYITVTVDDVESPHLQEGQQAIVNGLSVRYINGLYQAYAGGVHQATLCLS